MLVNPRAELGSPIARLAQSLKLDRELIPCQRKQIHCMNLPEIGQTSRVSCGRGFRQNLFRTRRVRLGSTPDDNVANFLSKKLSAERQLGINGDMSDGHLAERAARAQKIIAAPGDFKVCEGCDSIVARRVATCPNCHGYRFNSSEEEIVAHAKLLASRPQTSVTESDME